jgi:glutamate 5-kinase
MTKQQQAPPDREVTAKERYTLNLGHCPDCRGRGFVLGPRGGMAVNIECAQITCRARFNVVIFSGAVQHAQRIESRAEGGPEWPSEPRPHRQ